MPHELIQKPSGSAAQERRAALPLQEGPVMKKDILLKAISERGVGRFKSRHLAAGFQGAKCSDEAVLHHATERDPEAEAKAASLELLQLKFDISREAYGTEDAYVVMKSMGGISLLAIHGIVRNGEGPCGLATLAIKLPQELLADALRELRADPEFINEILHSTVPESSPLAFSIKTRIDVIFDRDYKAFPLQGRKGTPGG